MVPSLGRPVVSKEKHQSVTWENSGTMGHGGTKKEWGTTVRQWDSGTLYGFLLSGGGSDRNAFSVEFRITTSQL